VSKNSDLLKILSEIAVETAEISELMLKGDEIILIIHSKVRRIQDKYNRLTIEIWKQDDGEKRPDAM
jgi:hypothetical protein